MAGAAPLTSRGVHSGAMQGPGAVLRMARDIVRSGVLGDIGFCRGFFQNWGDCVHLIDTVQFVFDEAAPVSVTAQATPNMLLVTCRFPGFIASFESRGTPFRGTSFHGANATLMVNRDSYSIFTNGAARALAVKRNKMRLEL
jgi:predicted dehydrogenase